MTLYNHINIVEYNFEFSAVITMHFKGVIIYLRNHNLLINNVSFSDYLLGNFDWGVIILGESLLTVTPDSARSKKC